MPKRHQTDAPLKLLALYLLRILEEKTSSDHPLSIEELRRAVSRDYNLDVERKTVAQHLQMLSRFDPRVQCLTKQRAGKNGETTSVSCGWYCEPQLEREEVRFLADALATTRMIPQHQKRDLWKKIQILGGAYAHDLKGAADFYQATPQTLVNKQLFLTISILDEALENGWRVRFFLGVRDIKGNLIKDPSPSNRLYEVDPLFMAASGGRYYLAACFPGDQQAYHFRIEVMLDAEICQDEAGSPIPAETSLDAHFDIPAYVDDHPYMYSDPIDTFTLRVKDIPGMRLHVFDQFGPTVRLTREDSDHLLATVRSNKDAMRFWARQFADGVEVLEPETLRKQLHEDGNNLRKLYGGNQEEAPDDNQ